ncbi:hypothetical protein predicted by Glimmer/Critica (plasmid) [Acetobacter ghanensis]|uniref:Uncharacterized protein n=1 Tax=Acetobacter ghanensis TaxID=431306 RepID=A0A0U4YFM8_9PROT|nr:hypothetical protein predicted by Glimmer/Critica [Acetobacter ghanensis]
MGSTRGDNDTALFGRLKQNRMRNEDSNALRRAMPAVHIATAEDCIK